LALVVNLATDTIEVDAPWWSPAVWATVVVLVVVAAGVEWIRVRAVRVSTVDPAVMLGQAADDLAEAVASQWRAEVNARGLGHAYSPSNPAGCGGDIRSGDHYGLPLDWRWLSSGPVPANTGRDR
jgi:hypothetical protein